MSYKVLSNLRYNSKNYKVGDVIDELDPQTASRLASIKVIEDTAAPATPTETPATPAPSNNEELERGTVDSQVAAKVNQDLEDAKRMAQTPGQPVVNGKAQPAAKQSIISKAKSALSNSDAPAAPATPTAAQIAKDPQLQQ